MKILIITDTEEQIAELNKKNHQFVKHLTWHTKRRIEGANVTIMFSTSKDILRDGGTCGMQIDAVINLSESSYDQLKYVIGPCLI